MVPGLVAAKVLINNMRKRSREELTPIPIVYEDERKTLVSDASPEAAAVHLPLLHNLQTQLYRQRSKLVPPNPKSAADLVLTGEWRFTETSQPFNLINDIVNDSRMLALATTFVRVT